MKNPSKSPLAPFGQALLAYWQGNQSATLMHEFKTGQKRSLPVSVFFRSREEFLPTDYGFAYCRGRILVVGAGTGVHALELERQGFEVTAIDICPEAVQIMKERGIKDARFQDFLEFHGERFDTIFMLGHNIGICETLDGLGTLLDRCRRLLHPGGRVLVNSVAESSSADAADHQGYPGELTFRLSYEGESGPWMRWLHVDYDTLAVHASRHGWTTEELVATQEGGFLARLRPV